MPSYSRSLEHLLRYCARPAFALERLSLHVCRIAWAKFMAKIAEDFPLACPACGGDIRLIAFITDPAPIRKILTYLGEPLEPPPLAPARGGSARRLKITSQSTSISARRSAVRLHHRVRGGQTPDHRPTVTRPSLAKVPLTVLSVSNGVKIVLVENATRLARDLMVGEVILQQLTNAGCQVIAADSGPSA